MAEMQHEKVNVKKVPMQSASYLRNEERIKQDEAELAELIKQDKEAKGIVDEPDEESSEDQPSSEESEAEPAQALPTIIEDNVFLGAMSEVVEGIIVGDFIIYDILKKSKGTAIRIRDEEMLEGVSLLASEEGIFAAPEGGAIVMASKKLRENGFIKDSDKVVIVNTGSAYKYFLVIHYCLLLFKKLDREGIIFYFH